MSLSVEELKAELAAIDINTGGRGKGKLAWRLWHSRNAMQQWPTPPVAFTIGNCKMNAEEWKVYEAYARTGVRRIAEEMYDVLDEGGPVRNLTMEGWKKLGLYDVRRGSTNLASVDVAPTVGESIGGASPAAPAQSHQQASGGSSSVGESESGFDLVLGCDFKEFFEAEGMPFDKRDLGKRAKSAVVTRKKPPPDGPETLYNLDAADFYMDVKREEAPPGPAFPTRKKFQCEREVASASGRSTIHPDSGEDVPALFSDGRSTPPNHRCPVTPPGAVPFDGN